MLCCAFYARVVVVVCCTEQKSDVLDKRTDKKERPSREFLSREESFFGFPSFFELLF